MTKQELAGRLKELRKTAKLSQAKLSEELEISNRLYEYYESPTSKHLPTCKNLIKLATFYDCSIDYILCQTDNPRRNM